MNKETINESKREPGVIGGFIPLYLPLSFLIQLDESLSEYPEVKKKLLEIDPTVEPFLDEAEDLIRVLRGVVEIPHGRYKKEIIKCAADSFISVEEFMAGEYPLIKVGQIGDYFVQYNKEKEIITAGCQTVTLAEMRQIKNQLNNNNIGESFALQCGSVIVFNRDWAGENCFIIMDGGTRYVIRDWEFMEIYRRLNLSAEPESNETGQ